MKHIGLIGANGHIGSRILAEALEAGHTVRAIVRSPEKVTVTHPRLTVVKGNVFQPETIAAALDGLDVLVSAIAPSRHPDEKFTKAAGNLVALVRDAGIPRLVCVGGAGSLEVAPGVRLIDSGAIPDDWKWLVQDHIDALGVLKASDIAWTFFSPAGEIAPGTRTGKYRLGGTSLIVDQEGKSRISTEDYAAALVAELENGAYIRSQFTIGY